MTDTLHIAIAGIAGRMGRQLYEAAGDLGHHVSGGTEAASSPYAGQSLTLLFPEAEGGPLINAEPGAAAKGANVWIDFTVPGATLAALEVLADQGVTAAIVGTTGFTEADEAKIAAASTRLSIVKAGNFSLGVNLMQALVRQAAARLSEDWDIDILETHHRRKVDAPSGTALMLGEAVADGRGKALPEIRSAPYDGPEAARKPGEVGFAVRRIGDVAGEHEVMFGSDLEVLRISHTALDRSVFAHGAVKAAEWAVQQPPGLYNMDDVLGV